jgi:uncharacterized membrane protein YdjX (TVP38/TMEM64 family)
MEVETKSQHRKWIHIPLIILLFAVLGLTVWYYFSMYDRFNSKNVQAFIRGFGPWAPVAFAFLYAVGSPIPFVSLILSPLGGLLFGTLKGSLLVIGVATFSSLIPFLMARRLGREWVASKIKGEKLSEIYEKSQGQTGFTFILLMRLIPILPWEVQNYVAGLTQIAIPKFLIATALGIIPGSGALVFLGESITDPTSWQFFAALGFNAIVMIGAPLIARLVMNRNKKRKEEAEV